MFKTLDEVIQVLNEERSFDRSDVPDRLLGCKIWHAIVSFPGCLGDSHAIARGRKDATSSVEYWIDSETEFSLRYIRGRLRRFGICYLRDGRVITLSHDTVSDLI